MASKSIVRDVEKTGNLCCVSALAGQTVETLNKGEDAHYTKQCGDKDVLKDYDATERRTS